MEELKTCPICGGTNLAMSRCVCTNMDHEFMPDAVHMHVFDLYCKECGCRVQAGGDTYDEAKEAVVEKWNSRAERTCHPIEIFEEETFGTGIYFECSECHETLGAASRHGDSIPNYCPYCGARVAEE